MQHDFVAYDEEPEASEQNYGLGQKSEGGKRGKGKNHGLSQICKSVDCVNILSGFVATRDNERLQELFDAFSAEFSKTIESQLVKRLETWTSENNTE